MKIIRNSIIPFKGFAAINLFGVVFVRKEMQTYFDYDPSAYDRMINHETTHTKQMQELLYLPFYVWYLLEWLVRLVMYREARKAYRNISFEREAYANQDNRYYNKERKRYSFLQYIKKQ